MHLKLHRDASHAVRSGFQPPAALNETSAAAAAAAAAAAYEERGGQSFQVHSCHTNDPERGNTPVFIRCVT
jgi:hypothetical protein